MNTPPPTVAIMSPGDMGHAVGGLLQRHGLDVITSLRGRSARTQALAAKAGIRVVADDNAMVNQADLLLSIMVPSKALAFAKELAPVIRQSAEDLVYVDCNAIAPETAIEIGKTVDGAGALFVDAGIIGPPPRQNSDSTRIYASGSQAETLARLNEFGLDVRVIGETLGDASAIKMCYAALTKGTTALMTGLSLTAERLGISTALRAEFELSQAAMFDRMQRQVPSMVPKAHRWVGEMEEIAKTFDAAGVTPKFFQAAAAIYEDVAKASLAETTQEDWNASNKRYDQVIEDLAQQK